MPDILFLDYETRNELDLTVVGVHNYVRHPSNKIIISAFAWNNDPVQVWDCSLPLPLRHPIGNYSVVSWNATFERLQTKYGLGIDIPMERFFDPMIQARHLSMPGKLEKVCEILHLEEGKLEGKKLKDLFCLPAHPGGMETLFGISEARFNDFNSHPIEWKEFIEYGRRDTEVLRKIYTLFLNHPLPASEREGYLLDQKINDHGLPVDLELIEKLDRVAKRGKESAYNKIKELSGVNNPNSRPQLLTWLKSRGYPFNSLEKPMVAASMDDIGMSSVAAEVLELRKESAKTSDAKLEAMKLAVSADGFVRDQYSYLGAPRTGRWSGHAVQPHNMPRPTKEVDKKLDRAVELVLAEDYEGLKEFSSIMDVVSGCIRPCIKAPEGHKLVACDLAAIEHRVVGWVSGCDSILEIHRQGRDPYLDFAETLYKIPYKDMIYLGKNGEHKCKEEYKDIRQLSKPPVLGCGFGLSGGEESTNKDGDAILTGMMGYAKNQCGVDMPKELAHKAVGIYRSKHPEVPDFWYNLEEAAIDCIKTKRRIKLRKIVLDMHGQAFRIQLPSGRFLHYIRPKIRKTEFRGKDRDEITFEGIGNHHWVRLGTYGGKLCENVVQAIARDILLNGMKNADKAGLKICGHTHDEILVLAKKSDSVLDILRSSMIASPEWAKDLPLGAEGFETIRYRKG
jgi:DNA polymerase bacteriophage-type